MCGCRRYANTPEGEWSDAQKRRAARDARYKTSHSASNMKFVEVSKPLAACAKSTIKRKTLHACRDHDNGHHEHQGRLASLVAARSGYIDKKYYNRDVKVYKAADSAKNSSVEDFPPLSANAVQKSFPLKRMLPMGSRWADHFSSCGDAPSVPPSTYGVDDGVTSETASLNKFVDKDSVDEVAGVSNPSAT